MVNTKTVVRSKRGLDARPAALIATRAVRFKSAIRIGHDSRWVDAKSVVGMMLLGAPQGATMTIQAEGEDEELAVEALSGIFADAFGDVV